MRTPHPAAIFAVLAALVFLLGREVLLLPDGRVHLYALDVGQGDALLIVTPSGRQIVVDGGPDTSVLRALGDHHAFFDRTIELLVLTHPDADHVTGLPDVLRRYRVERVLIAGVRHGSARYADFLDALEKENAQVLLADAAEDVDLGDGVTLDVAWPPTQWRGTLPKAANDASVVLRVLHPWGSMLLTGDIEAEAEAAILASGIDIRADVLKVPHHGSRTSSSTGFLLAVDPDLAVVSAGRDNPFGHPHADVIARYHALGIPVRSTREEGMVHLAFGPDPGVWHRIIPRFAPRTPGESR